MTYKSQHTPTYTNEKAHIDKGKRPLYVFMLDSKDDYHYKFALYICDYDKKHYKILLGAYEEGIESIYNDNLTSIDAMIIIKDKEKADKLISILSDRHITHEGKLTMFRAVKELNKL